MSFIAKVNFNVVASFKRKFNLTSADKEGCIKEFLYYMRSFRVDEMGLEEEYEMYNMSVQQISEERFEVTYFVETYNEIEANGTVIDLTVDVYPEETKYRRADMFAKYYLEDDSFKYAKTSGYIATVKFQMSAIFVKDLSESEQLETVKNHLQYLPDEDDVYELQVTKINANKRTRNVFEIAYYVKYNNKDQAKFDAEFMSDMDPDRNYTRVIRDYDFKDNTFEYVKL